MTQRIKKAQERLKKLEHKRRKIEVQYSLEKSKLKEYERRARTRKLIEIGGLAEIAQISHYTPEAILGAMIQIADLFEDEQSLKVFTIKGLEILESRKYP